MPSIVTTSQKYRITLIEDMLGTIVKDKDVFKEYLAAAALEAGTAPEQVDESVEAVPPPPDRKGSETGFYTDDEGIFLFDYQFRGFLREAANTLAGPDQLNIKNLRSKFTNFVFVTPRKIRIFGVSPLNSVPMLQIIKPDDQFTRPVRAMTMQGPRVSLVRSDIVKAGRWFDLEISLLKNKEKIDFDVIETVMEYGKLQGLLQFRTGGWGRFSFEKIK